MSQVDIESAVSFLNRHGYARTNLAAVAEAQGMSAARFYDQIPCKEVLAVRWFALIVQRVIGELLSAGEMEQDDDESEESPCEEAPEPPPELPELEELLQTYFLGVLRECQGQREFVCGFLTHSPPRLPLDAQHYLDARGQFRADAARLIEAIREDARLPEVIDDDRLADALLAATGFFILRWSMDHSSAYSDTMLLVAHLSAIAGGLIAQEPGCEHSSLALRVSELLVLLRNVHLSRLVRALVPRDQVEDMGHLYERLLDSIYGS